MHKGYRSARNVRNRLGAVQVEKSPAGSNIPKEVDEYLNSKLTGPIRVAKRKRPDSLYLNISKILLTLASLVMLYYVYYNFDEFHAHVTHGYARLGYTEAQHMLGQRYLQGKGVDKNHSAAMEWFHKAAVQGHAHAAYNLAVGHFKGVHHINDSSAVYNHLSHAAQNGVAEAVLALKHFCQHHDCQIYTGESAY